MADITITIPNNILTRVINGICLFYGYQDTIDGLPNPQTKAQFAKAKIIEHIKHCVRTVEKDAQVSALKISIDQEVETNIALN